MKYIFSKPGPLLRAILDQRRVSLAVDIDERSKLMIDSRQGFIIIQHLFMIYGAAARYRRRRCRHASSIFSDRHVHPQEAKIAVGAAAELNQLQNCVQFWLRKAERGFHLHLLILIKRSRFLSLFRYFLFLFFLFSVFLFGGLFSCVKFSNSKVTYIWKAWMLDKPGIWD